MQPLTIEDSRNTIGGESIWYWISYAAGWTVREIEEEIERLHDSKPYEWSPARPYG